MEIKAIVLDLDGTILRSDKSISERTLTMLERCRQRGVKVAVATARSESSAQRFLAQLKPDGVVSNGGALVRCNGVTVWESLVPAGTADRLMAQLQQLPGYAELTVETKAGYYVSWDTPSHGDYAHSRYHDFRQPLGQDAYKITAHLENETGLQALADRYPQCGLIPFSDGPWYRLADKQATKMTAIFRLAAHFGIDVSGLVAFGDDLNDEEMLRGCGVGVAMGNGISRVKEIADFICDTNDNDGVAKWLEQYLLAGDPRESWNGSAPTATR